MDKTKKIKSVKLQGNFLKKFTKTITRKKYKMSSLLLKSLEPGLVDESSFVPYDPSQEPLFPPELTLSPHLDQQELVFRYYLYTLYTTVLQSVDRAIVCFFGGTPKASIIVPDFTISVYNSLCNYLVFGLLFSQSTRQIYKFVRTQFMYTVTSRSHQQEYRAFCK